MKVRRSAKRELGTALGEFDEVRAIEAESRMRDRVKALKSRGFEKTRDLPLGIVIERQRSQTVYKAISAALKEASIVQGSSRISVGGFPVLVRKQDAEKATEIILEVLKKSKHAKSGEADLERRFWLYKR